MSEPLAPPRRSRGPVRRLGVLGTLAALAAVSVPTIAFVGAPTAGAAPAAVTAAPTAVPATATAAPAATTAAADVSTTVDRDVPEATPGADRAGSASRTTTRTHTDVADFRSIGIRLTTTAATPGRLRVHQAGGWGPWIEVDFMDSGPAAGSAEGQRAAAAAAGTRASEPVWVGHADGYQVEVPADATNLAVELARDHAGPVGHTDTPTVPPPTGLLPSTSRFGMPQIHTRAEWGARLPVDDWEVMPDIKYAIVHHSVSENDYGPGDVPAILRSVQAFHMDGRGWNDIGYNFAIDKFGGIWEGRGGGIDQPILGAHAFDQNWESAGIVALGDYSTAGPTQAMLDAYAQLIGWRLWIGGADAFASVEGHAAVVGHRDVNQTECPGNYLYDRIPTILAGARAKQSQLYDPSGNWAPEGAFVRSRQTGAVHRIAGGAPVWVTTWSAFPGTQPYLSVNQPAIDALRQQPADGTVLIGSQRGEYYVVAGGAPIYISVPQAIPPSPAPVFVDNVAIDNAGAGGLWNHLSARPADNTVLIARQSGSGYVTAGGAPIYLSKPSAIPPGRPWVYVDALAIGNAGIGGVYDHLAYRPADGTFIVGRQRQELYNIAGGAPLYVSSLSVIPPGTTFTTVDDVAIDNAGNGGVYSHLRLRPVDGTVLLGKQRGEIYVVAGGAPIYIAVPSAIPVGARINVVDIGNLDLMNAGFPWNRLRQYPADGTYLQGTGRGDLYVVAGGAPIYVSTMAAVTPGATWIPVDYHSIDAAGNPSPYHHLRFRPVAGTVLRAVPGGARSQVNASGAPLPASPTAAPFVDVDGKAITNAGKALPWAHLAKP